jgi:hypothetical protein
LDSNYVKDYASAMSSQNMYGSLFNPMILNEVLKNINMTPSAQTRTNLLKMVHDPRRFEQGLRRFAQYLYNVQMPFKRLIHYYANMLSFDLSIYPINATEEDMKTDKFKRDYERVWEFFGNFNYKKEFRQINIGMILEDAKFMYLRTDEGTGRITFQEMPTDFCMIDAKFEYGWLYSFDLQYFCRQGVDIDGFAPEFKDYYNNYRKLVNDKIYVPNIRVEQRDGRWCYWQQINPVNSWVFKFHSIYAGLVPPLLGLFVDANEIDNFKNLQSSKTALDMFKLLIGTIPTNKSKDASLTDDLCISADLAGSFNKLINDMLPDGIKFGTVPFSDVKAFDFSDNSQTKNDIVGDALNAFYTQAGIDSAMFNSKKPTSTTLNMSSLNDVSFADVVYNEFSSFLDYQLQFVTKKYKFKAKLSGSIYDREERFNRAITLAQYGIITPELSASIGLNEHELRSGMNLMDAMGFSKLITPLISANNMSGQDIKNNGRPEKKDKDLTEEGVNTKNTEANKNR